MRMDGTTVWQMTMRSIELNIATMVRQQVICSPVHCTILVNATSCAVAEVSTWGTAQAASPWAWMQQVISLFEVRHERQHLAKTRNRLTAGL